MSYALSPQRGTHRKRDTLYCPSCQALSRQGLYEPEIWMLLLHSSGLCMEPWPGSTWLHSFAPPETPPPWPFSFHHHSAMIKKQLIENDWAEKCMQGWEMKGVWQGHIGFSPQIKHYRCTWGQNDLWEECVLGMYFHVQSIRFRVPKNQTVEEKKALPL